MRSDNQAQLQPAQHCREALQAIEVSEERRKRRKRDTGPDVIGMQMKRDLLRQVTEEEPSAEQFEAWLLEKVLESEVPGALRAMAEEVLADYQSACMFHEFNDWLGKGAPTPSVRNKRPGANPG